MKIKIILFPFFSTTKETMKATTAVAKAMVGASTAITTETTKATTAVAVAVAKATTLARAVAVATQRRRMVVTAAAKSGAGIKTIHMEPKPLKKKIEAA